MSPERVIPESCEDQELLAHHIARYEFAKNYVEGKTVLDIACGMGYGSAILSQGSPKRVIGVDISLSAIEYARNHYRIPGVEFQQGNAEMIDKFAMSDVVVSFETIEHLKHHEMFLSGAAKILGHRGLLIISTPERTRGTIVERPENPYHEQEWTAEDFKSLLQEYFTNVELYGQYLLRKLWFPGSRTLMGSLFSVLYPERMKDFKKFHVKRNPPRLPGLPYIRGFVVAVCGRQSLR